MGCRPIVFLSWLPLLKAEAGPAACGASGRRDGTDVGWNPNQVERLRFFREKLEFYPDTVVDIGANVGDWSKMARPISPEAHFLMVEADPRHTAALASTGVPFEIALLASNENASVTFHTTRYGITTGASMYRERTSLYQDPKLALP